MTLPQTNMYNKKVKLTVSINITWMSRKNALELHICYITYLVMITAC